MFPKNLKCLFVATETIKIYGLVLTGCGSVVNNTLTSPGYPNDYPKQMHCVYKVPILRGLALKITFQDFNLQEDSLCKYVKTHFLLTELSLPFSRTVL